MAVAAALQTQSSDGCGGDSRNAIRRSFLLTSSLRCLPPFQGRSPLSGGHTCIYGLANRREATEQVRRLGVAAGEDEVAVLQPWSSGEDQAESFYFFSSKLRDGQQAKRRGNIEEKARQQKARKIAKREKKLMRPGFEARKEGYIGDK